MLSAFLIATIAVVLAEIGDKTQLMKIALAADEAVKQEAVQTALAGKPIRKVICVPGRLINIVA